MNTPAFLALLEAAGISSPDILFIEDNFAVGPIRDLRDLTEWAKVRSEFWQAQKDGSQFDYLGLPARFDAASSICYWLGPDLSSAICLAWLSNPYESWCRTQRKLLLVPVLAHPRTGQPIPKIGLLQPGDIAWTPASAQPLQSDEAAFLKLIWRAVTSDSPSLLDQLKSAKQPTRMPVANTVRDMKLFYPLVSKGVNSIALRALQLLRQGTQPFSGLLAQYIIKFGDEPSFYGDFALKRELLALADNKLSKPLLKVAGSASLKPEVSISTDGEAVLNGALDYVSANGVDCWIGGVHLSGAKKIWRYDSHADRFVNA